jgi:hypothetical protein
MKSAQRGHMDYDLALRFYPALSLLVMLWLPCGVQLATGAGAELST